MIVLLLVLLTGTGIFLFGGHPAAESGTQAIYIYMCGSNLETKGGAATKNIAEMLDAALPDGEYAAKIELILDVFDEIGNDVAYGA